MVIALLFISLLGGLAGVSIVVFAGMGLGMGILAYMTGGMLGTVGFLASLALRCHLDTAHAQAAPQISASRG